MEDPSKENPNKEIEIAVKNLRNQINEEREKILMVKNRYGSKLEERNELEKILRSCINDYKDDLWDLKTEMRNVDPKETSGLDEKLKVTVKEIIDREKKLTLLYDKMFHIKALAKETDKIMAE